MKTAVLQFLLIKFIKETPAQIFRENCSKVLGTAFFVKKQLWWLLLYIQK